MAKLFARVTRLIGGGVLALTLTTAIQGCSDPASPDPELTAARVSGPPAFYRLLVVRPVPAAPGSHRLAYETKVVWLRPVMADEPLPEVLK